MEVKQVFIELCYDDNRICKLLSHKTLIKEII